MGDLKAALWGTEYKKKQSKDLITDVPDGFKEWVAENMDAQANWSSTPYFIRDNFVDGDLSKGLKIALPTVEPETPKVDPVQAQRDLIAKAHQAINQTQILLDKSKAMNKPIANPLSEKVKNRRSQIREEAKKTLSGTTMTNPAFPKPINISSRAIKEWLNQPFFNPEAKNECLLYLPTLMRNAEYKGFGVDKHTPNAKAHIFQIKISNTPCWVIVREFHDGVCNIHSLTDNISILEILDVKKP